MTQPLATIFTDDHEIFLIIPDIAGLEGHFIPVSNHVIKELHSIIKGNEELHNKYLMAMALKEILTIINEGTIKENIEKLESRLVHYYCIRYFVCNIPIKIALIKK
jgi:hypothetical protein